jgi:hypothetical protein
MRIPTILSAVLVAVCACAGGPAKAYDYADSTRLQLNFSFGEGVYYHYNCCTYCDCNTTTVAPADLEVLLGFRLSHSLYVDLAGVWSIDFDHYGGQVTTMFGLRPGLRFLIPGIFRRLWYLRLALPVHFGMSGRNDDILVGLLVGFGLEIPFGNIGLFGEVDFSPYFVEVADNYYVIPAQGRLGVSLHF